MIKHIVVLIICISVINCSYSQESSNVKDSNDIGIVRPENHDFEYVMKKMIDFGEESNYHKLLNDLKEFENQGDSIRYSWKTEFQEQIVNIKTIGIGKYGKFEMFLQNPYILKLIRQDNEIIYISVINSTNWIKAKRGNLEGELIKETTDEIKMKEMLDTYYNRYNSKLDLNVLFNIRGSFDDR